MIIKTGISVEGLNGSAGGTTAARNKSRQYFKVRTAPRNPRTEDQSKARARMIGISKSWSGLTETQRMAWDEFAKSQKGRRVLGEAAVLSGFNAFCRISIDAYLVNETPSLNPPVDTVFGELTDIIVNVDNTGDFRVSANYLIPNIATEDNFVNVQGTGIIYATPILPDGRNGDTTALRIVEIGEAGSTSARPGEIVEVRGNSINVPFFEKFGQSLVPGLKIQLGFKYVCTETGKVGLSTMRILKTVVLPAPPPPAGN